MLGCVDHPSGLDSTAAHSATDSLNNIGLWGSPCQKDLGAVKGTYYHAVISNVESMLAEIARCGHITSLSTHRDDSPLPIFLQTDNNIASEAHIFIY